MTRHIPQTTSTNIARGLVYFMGLAILAVCFILLPEIAREEAASDPSIHRTTVPFFIAAYLLATPCFIALHQILRLLGYLDQGKAFSEQSVAALRYIKLCAIAFSGMVAAIAIGGRISILLTDPAEDIAPLLGMAFMLAFAASVIATFVAVLQRLLQDAIGMKAENDLTV